MRVLNLATGIGLVVAFVATFPFASTFFEFFSKRPASIDPSWLLPVLRTWMLLALPMVAAVHVSLSRLLDVVGTVGAGDPFVPENAVRLKTIAWCVLVTQLLDLAFGVMAALINAAGSNIEWKFSLTGWLAVVLLFVLARVFEEGTQLRDDLGTMI
nr:DUF2975 domain-containing protein [Lysobacter sp. MMG2]